MANSTRLNGSKRRLHSCTPHIAETVECHVGAVVHGTAGLNLTDSPENTEDVLLRTTGDNPQLRRQWCKADVGSLQGYYGSL
eukprot:32136-Eustigmatos_ZCMA.PRE.1